MHSYVGYWDNVDLLKSSCFTFSGDVLPSCMLYHPPHSLLTWVLCNIFGELGAQNNKVCICNCLKCMKCTNWINYTVAANKNNVYHSHLSSLATSADQMSHKQQWQFLHHVWCHALYSWTIFGDHYNSDFIFCMYMQLCSTNIQECKLYYTMV